MESQTSALELRYLVEEFSEVVGGRIDKVWSQDSLYVWQIYTGSNRLHLIFDVPTTAYLSLEKPAFKPPSGFGRFLRKRLSKGVIESLSQVGFDRIVRVVVRTQKETLHVYVELFGKGNFVVCDADDVIISAQEYVVFSDRAVRGGVEYQPPPPQPDTLRLSVDDLKQYFGDKPCGRVLAATLGLGGEIADMVLSIAGISPEDKDVDVQALHDSLRALLALKRPCYTEDAAYPFMVDGASPADSLSAAVAAVRNPLWEQARKESRVEKSAARLSRQENILRSQEQQLKKFFAGAEENQAVGEWLYEHYQDVHELLTSARQDKKKLSAEAFKKKYESHRLVKRADKQFLELEKD